MQIFDPFKNITRTGQVCIALLIAELCSEESSPRAARIMRRAARRRRR